MATSKTESNTPGVDAPWKTEAPTKLEAFIKSRALKPARLARESEYSRQHLLRIRKGGMEPTRRCIAAIVAACRRLTFEDIHASDLFQLDEERASIVAPFDATTTVFLQILGRMGVPLQFFADTLRPAESRDAAVEQIEKLGSSRVEESIKRAAVTYTLSVDSQRLLVKMFARLRSEIARVNDIGIRDSAAPSS